MKKTLIALAIASGAVAVAQAKDITTLYGSLGFNTTISNVSTKVDTFTNNNWDIGVSTLKLGVKGEESLDGGMSAFYKIELGSDGDSSGLNKTKKAYVGFKGDFGKFTIGKQGSQWSSAVGMGVFESVGANPLNVDGDDDGNGFAPAGQLSRALSAFYDNLPSDESEASAKEFVRTLGTGTRSKRVAYTSPDFSGFTVGTSVVIDGDNKKSKGVDMWEVAAAYKNNGLKAGLAYSNGGYAKDVAQVGNYSISSELDGRFIAAKIGYETDVYNVQARVLNVKNDFHLDGVDQQGVRDRAAGIVEKGTEFLVEGQYFTGPHTLSAGIGYMNGTSRVRVDAVNVDYDDFSGKSLQLAAGYKYNFSDRTYTWVETEWRRTGYHGTESGVPKSGSKRDWQAVVGVRHDF